MQKISVRKAVAIQLTPLSDESHAVLIAGPKSAKLRPGAWSREPRHRDRAAGFGTNSGSICAETRGRSMPEHPPGESLHVPRPSFTNMAVDALPPFTDG